MLVQQYSDTDSIQREETWKSLIYYRASEELYEARRLLAEKMASAGAWEILLKSN